MEEKVKRWSSTALLDGGMVVVDVKPLVRITAASGAVVLRERGVVVDAERAQLH